MTAKQQDITLIAGDSRTVYFVCTLPDGSPVALSGASAIWWVGPDLDPHRNSNVFTKTGVVEPVTVDGTEFWRVTIDLSPSDTQTLDPRTYVHQVKVSTQGRTYTVAEGALVIEPSLVS